jgi:nitrate/nitrite transport system substrate-binding protein
MTKTCTHDGLREAPCSCGTRQVPAKDADGTLAESVEASLLQALFPSELTRRKLIGAVGASTLFGALSSFVPVEALKALAADAGAAPEKPDLQIGFLPITCATPLIMGSHLGLFQKYGLNVKLNKVAGIALIRDKLLNGELDLSQQVMPVPIRSLWG